MADAEDVLIAAAERVGAATRALWEHRSAPRDRAVPREARAERRIAAWLRACFGAGLPIAGCDAPPAPRWLERVLSQPAPWQERPCAAACTDGIRLLLPRARLEGETAADAEQLLLAALAQGLRVARARETPERRSPLERDLRFALEAALGDAELATAFPGLAQALDAARDTARAGRPPLAGLRPAEREAEMLVRALLQGPAVGAVGRAAALLGAEPEPAAISTFAERCAIRRS